MSDIAWTVGAAALFERSSNAITRCPSCWLTNVGGADTFCRCHPTAACKPPSELAS